MQTGLCCIRDMNIARHHQQLFVRKPTKKIQTAKLQKAVNLLSHFVVKEY